MKFATHSVLLLLGGLFLVGCSPPPNLTQGAFLVSKKQELADKPSACFVIYCADSTTDRYRALLMKLPGSFGEPAATIQFSNGIMFTTKARVNFQIEDLKVSEGPGTIPFNLVGSRITSKMQDIEGFRERSAQYTLTPQEERVAPLELTLPSNFGNVGDYIAELPDGRITCQKGTNMILEATP